MKIMYGLLLFVCASMATTEALPCWSDKNTCGAAYCVEDPPGGSIVDTCFHTYCDDVYTCGWDPSKTEVLTRLRQKYIWVEWVNGQQIVHNCYGTILDEWEVGACCDCQVPGVYYSH